MSDDVQLTLVVVSGPPASGKTEAVESLARKIELPFFSKDTFKERLYEVFGHDDDGSLEERIEAAGLAILLSVAEAQLGAGISVAAESNFHPEEAESVRELAERHGARIVQVHIGGAPEELADRFSERSVSGDRHPGHGDAPSDAGEVRGKVEDGRFDPLDLSGELIQDELGYDEDALVDRILMTLRG